MPYTTKIAIQNYLLLNINSSFDAQLNSYIAAMSEYIDEQAGFPVYRDNVTTRRYDGSGCSKLRIDPVHGDIAVSVDGEVVDAETLVFRPYNNPVKSDVVLESGHFTQGTANVAVTGIFSRYSTLPEKIKWACTVLVALIVNQANDQSEGVQSEKIGDYQVSFRSAEDRRDYALAKEIIKGLAPITF